jgi:hypothetical protein
MLFIECLSLSCIIVFGPFCWKMCQRYIVYTLYMHSALTGVQVLVIPPHSRACSLIGSLFSGVYMTVMTEKGITIEISYSDVHLLVTFFLGFYIVTTGNMFLILPRIQNLKREWTSKHSAIWFYSGAMPPCNNQIASCLDDLSMASFFIRNVLPPK